MEREKRKIFIRRLESDQIVPTEIDMTNLTEIVFDFGHHQLAVRFDYEDCLRVLSETGTLALLPSASNVIRIWPRR